MICHGLDSLWMGVDEMIVKEGTMVIESGL